MSKMSLTIEINLSEKDLLGILENQVTAKYIEQSLINFFPVKPEQIKVTVKEGPWK